MDDPDDDMPYDATSDEMIFVATIILSVGGILMLLCCGSACAIGRYDKWLCRCTKRSNVDRVARA